VWEIRPSNGAEAARNSGAKIPLFASWSKYPAKQDEVIGFLKSI